MTMDPRQKCAPGAVALKSAAPTDAEVEAAVRAILPGTRPATDDERIDAEALARVALTAAAEVRAAVAR